MAKLNLRSSYWIVDDDGNIIVGRGRAEILANIEKTGSINQAAKIMRMSYKGVWSKIKVTEDYLQVKLVETDKKRGSELSSEGKQLLEKYNQLKERCLEADDKIFREIFG